MPQLLESLQLLKEHEAGIKETLELRGEALTGSRQKKTTTIQTRTQTRGQFITQFITWV
jgi:hypothetical protein